MRHQQKKQAIKKQLEMPLAAPKTVHLQAGACCIHISLAYPSVHLPRARGIHQYLEMDLKAASAIKCEHFMDAFRANIENCSVCGQDSNISSDFIRWNFWNKIFRGRNSALGASVQRNEGAEAGGSSICIRDVVLNS